MILAHQGGWDEVLYVLGPMLVVALLLGLANRRALRKMQDAQDTSEPPADVERSDPSRLIDPPSP